MEPVKRLIQSYDSNLIFSLRNSQVITLNHFLLGVGLLNITGLKLPILSHIRHSIDYNLVCEIEIAETEVSQNFYENRICKLPQLAESPLLAF